MAQHKWHKEIKAWADGAEIEIRTPLSKYIALHSWNKFQGNTFPMVEFEDGIPMDVEYRIKPQPKVTEKDWNRRMAEKALAIPEISDAVDRLFEAFAVKEPQYLYVYGDLSWDEQSYKLTRRQGDFGTYIGKIKLEVDDEAS